MCAAQAGITVHELVKREYEEGMAANAAVSALAAQAGLTVEQLEFHSGITGAELKKRLIKGEYDEGLATDAARNARLWRDAPVEKEPRHVAHVCSLAFVSLRHGAHV